MRYFVAADQFLELPITSGTVQNISNTDIEVSNEQVAGSGLILKAGEMIAFQNATIYVAARPVLDGGSGIISAVPFKIGGEGGGGGGSSYVLPIATASTLGGVKSSSAAGGISVDATGKMTYNAPTSEPLSAPEWETGTAYTENALVEYDNNLYMCLVAHTSGTFADDLTAGKWQLVSMVLQTATASVLGGVKSSNTEGNVTVNNDGTMTYNAPAFAAPEWETGTAYTENELVENNDSIYMCLVAHTSGTFATDLEAGKWKEVGSTYNLPTASNSTLGGVKSSSVAGKISVDPDTGVMTYNVPETELSVGEVGYVSWQYSLLSNHLPLDGSTISDASQDYPELLAFFNDNNLMAATAADYADNKALCYYDSGTDELTMPDFLDKTVWGGNTIEEKEAGLPNITGGDDNLISVTSGNINAPAGTVTIDGALIKENHDPILRSNVGDGSSHQFWRIKFDASRSSSIYSDSVNTVQPPAIQLIPQIRFAKDVVINDGTPIGTVISFLGLTAPTGYLACDGTSYNIADYAGLASFIMAQYGAVDYFGGDGTTTFAVPDLRGEFLRGTGTNSHENQGNGASVGVHQDATTVGDFVVEAGGTAGMYAPLTTKGGFATNADSVTLKAKPTDSDNTVTGRYYFASNGSDSYTGGSGGSLKTTRPTNTSVLYCIKF